MSKAKVQILSVHGGRTFRSKRDYLHWLKHREISLEPKEKWREAYLDRALGSRFHIIRPRMPLQDNARYAEWAIHFENYLAKLGERFMLVGTSLGGVFLAKYLSEHKLRKKPLATYLVCSPYDDTLPDEALAGGFRLKGDLSLLEKNAGRLHLLFSQNDDVVPVAHAKKYARKLPNADIVVYDHIPGHFDISAFPEIVTMIKQDAEQ